MSRSHRAPSAGAPTPYADLNELLATLVARVRARLGDNLVAAYLQGSFAVGDFNAHSDADIIVVVRDDIAEVDLPALQTMHGEIYELPSSWAEHLELSYFPAAILRRWSLTPRDPPGQPRTDDWADPGTSGLPPRVYPLLFLGHGARGLVRSEHDNTRVVRWVTRERGIALAGPPPADLIDPVSADSLKAEVRETLERVGEAYLGRGVAIDHVWHQSFLVTLACRVLHTLQTGEVRSKKAGAAWAAGALDARWRPLIERAQTAWLAGTLVKQGPSDPAEVAQTLAFLRYALAWKPPAAGRRAILERQLALKRQGPPPSHGTHPGGHPGRGGPAIQGRAPPPQTRPNNRGRRGPG